MKYLIIFSTLIFFARCTGIRSTSIKDGIKVKIDTVLSNGDSMEVITSLLNNTTLYKIYTDIRKIRPDSFDNSFSVELIRKQLKLSPSVRRTALFVQDSFYIYFDSVQAIQYCLNSIEKNKDPESRALAEDDYPALISYIKNKNNTGAPSNRNVYWISALMKNCDFIVENSRTKELPITVLKEDFKTDFSGGSTYYFVSAKKDTIPFLSFISWMR